MATTTDVQNSQAQTENMSNDMAIQMNTITQQQLTNQLRNAKAGASVDLANAAKTILGKVQL